MRRIYRIGSAALVGVLVLGAPALAEISNQTPVGETYAAFLEISQSARAAGMGDAYVAVADDINSVFWNPAGLTAMTRNRLQFAFTNTRWLLESQLNSAAVGVNTDYGALALSLVAFNTGDIEETTIFNPEGTGRILDTGSWAVGGVYAKQFTERFSVGFQARVIEEKLDRGYDYRVFDLAVGTFYHTGYRSLRIGMSLRNFGKDLVLLTDEAIKGKMPVFFSMATAAEVYGERGEDVSLTGAIEALYSVSVERRMHAGAELWLRNIVALRAGYKLGYDVQDVTAGAGVRLQRGIHHVQADFAYVKFDKFPDNGGTLRFSVTGSF